MGQGGDWRRSVEHDKEMAGLLQATVLLRYVPVREPATTAHRTSRLAGLSAIVALLHALEDVQVGHPQRSNTKHDLCGSIRAVRDDTTVVDPSSSCSGPVICVANI